MLRISPVLLIIFTKTFIEGQLPQNWKDALVIPLHKKGEKELDSNYCPINLTCIHVKLWNPLLKMKYFCS